MSPPVRIGISSCLLGEKVRFDGGHKRDPFLADTLGAHVEWVPVCPEVEAGLPTPRPSLRLVDDPDRSGGPPRLVMPRTGEDHTARMEEWAAGRVEELAGEDLCGYVLKRSSPSCGMERVKIYGEKGQPTRPGQGLFAAALVRRFPDLPVEEEGRLNDPVLRENFVERIFAYRRLKDLLAGNWKQRDLIAFHTAHKLTLMAHSPALYAELGRWVSQAQGIPRPEAEAYYRPCFMEALAIPVTPGRHVNVLQHMVGYFRDLVDSEVRAEISELIDDYQQGLVPLVVPVTLIRHYVRRLGIDYLAGQAYLELHPKELMLRNRV